MTPSSPATRTLAMSPAYTASEARALAAEARATAAEAMATAAEARYTEVVRHTEDSIQSALHPVLQSQTVRQAHHEQAYGEAVARLAAAEERAQREAQWRASKEQEVEAVQRQLRAALEAASRMQAHFESQVDGLKRRADDAEERARREYESRAARDGKHSASAAQMRQALEAERSTRAQQDEKREKAVAQAAARATAKSAAAEERAHRESVRAQVEADERASCEAQLAAMRLELQRAREASRDAAAEHGESRAELLDRVLTAEDRVKRSSRLDRTRVGRYCRPTRTRPRLTARLQPQCSNPVGGRRGRVACGTGGQARGGAGDAGGDVAGGAARDRTAERRARFFGVTARDGGGGGDA